MYIVLTYLSCYFNWGVNRKKCNELFKNSRQIIVVVNSTSLALTGLEPLLYELQSAPASLGRAMGIYGLVILSFELRYTFFRGWLPQF